MPELPAISETFLSRRTGEARRVPLTVRGGVDDDTAPAVIGDIVAVRWGDLWHAYGRADDVGDQLVAAAVGDDRTREAAWWELFGNIHHQGTIYEATLPAVPVLGRLAGWPAYPDRVIALSFLAAVAQAEGVVVWRYDADGRFAVDEARTAARSSELRPLILEVSATLLRAWSDEAEDVQGALLLLLAYLPELQEDYAELVAEVLPERFDAAWTAIRTGVDSQDAFDRIDAFERWAHSGAG